ncbi:arabinogalactan endo-1,4-beta-galactosidase [Clostridium acetobutylicum]|uniref:Arabinogalactan endo-beta-1,4-galactanase n=1 Tax=Clostridium acetobutylicum (strain ATCC 824 / DSM 792 / JCM 1419 / IAM 19013 / LMG 5710 / NBRC 13948 / NRRL B-527 / VKM B-1787 / 2291 / W) TaxID=272562 RepID=Q97G04_CLOAB|nr:MULTISPECIES: glycosyl hydrolase 53 family protein [Clostridium]AAK80519.1 Predicted arabinogalactan endo-1,4-beta-galactosidase [Clostridium acetobutylicum ATCC 824]ADZ21618.1 arabinogalactan endo-1,4-beta-galactosidase [Clostridium acetobutylicum EA 2018]AEI33978.1 arabinogalactan endo-1,4-beta-galactosidase [Clostridium acetobutylicum DSM 1731]AWV79063.1 arabinogalactan endo-1,4-beta-galactosidase [Clostridium acetobutylicum]MBC2394976.1 arabinogalactan endo-1,4-beta-galactosidase [Clost
MLKKLIKRISLMLLGTGLIINSAFFSISTSANTFANGADIGWLNQLENNGVKWQDTNGQRKDALQILKNHGINSVRLRVFVNPPSNFVWTKNDGSKCLLGYGDTKGVVYMAQRAKNLGMKVMIDFHYSDHFADPAYQDKPAAWINDNFNQLQKDVYSHTSYVMTALKNAGITPDWVQVGNETNSGMLWPDGNYRNFNKWAALINQGYSAIKYVSPTSKVIIHLSSGANNSLYRSVFDGLTKAGAKFDVIGMSYYPYWDKVNYTQNINNLSYNLNDMASRYHKQVMICEIGGLENDSTNTYNMIKQVISKVKAVPGSNGLGVFYWEPEANSSVLPDAYPLGSTSKVSNNVLRFTNAINAFN